MCNYVSRVPLPELEAHGLKPRSLDISTEIICRVVEIIFY